MEYSYTGVQPSTKIINDPHNEDWKSYAKLLYPADICKVCVYCVMPETNTTCQCRGANASTKLFLLQYVLHSSQLGQQTVCKD